MLGAPQGKQQKGKGKAKAGSGGAGGGPSGKAAAGSSGQGSSSQGGSRRSVLPSAIASLSITAEHAAQLPSKEATRVTRTDSSPQPATNTKKEKERQRIERQRQRKVEVASKALQWAMEAMAEHGARCVRSHEAPSNLRPSTPELCVLRVWACARWGSSASTMRAMEEATSEAEKYASRSEPLAALLAKAKDLIEQARAADAE